MPPSLTIAIPTYNRNPLLKSTLDKLVPQLDGSSRILIIDDHSPQPVEADLREEFRPMLGSQIQIVRNSANIGLSANVMRCFELCDTEWMWLLGDDDSISDNAIATIRQEIEAAGDSVFINFCPEQDPVRAAPYQTVGSEMLAVRLDNFSHLLFMSYGVYRTPFFKPNLRFGYHFAYSFAVHLILLFTSLKDDSSCRFSNKSICRHGGSRCETSMPDYKMWNWLNLGMGLPLLFELHLGRATRSSLAKKYYESVPVMGNCVWQLIEMSLSEGADALYLFDQLCKRNSLYFRGNASRKLKRILWYLLVRFPAIGRKVARTFIKARTGQTMTGEGIAGRFERL